MTTTTETTTTDRTTVIAVVRSEHYAANLLKIKAVTYLVCACGVTFLSTGEAGFRRHMVEMLGHRPQAIEIDRETGAMTIVCTCGDQPPMVADGTAYDLHRVHAEHPTVQPLVPEQRNRQCFCPEWTDADDYDGPSDYSDACAQTVCPAHDDQPIVPEQRSDQGSAKPALDPESFPYSAVLPTWALDALETAFHCRPELIIYRGGICYFSWQAVDVLRSPGALSQLGSKITDYPAGAELVVFAPQSFGPCGRFALTYRVV